jgi:DNA-binding MarR family transcriptional regulator
MTTPGLAHQLHLLVAGLDRTAERLLGEVDGSLTYARFLALLTVRRLGPTTQRALARELGLAEPTVSRTVGGMATRGLVEVTSTPGAGNRRTVDLTPLGSKLLDAAETRLEEAFDGLLAAAEVDRDPLEWSVRRLLTTLTEGAPS